MCKPSSSYTRTVVTHTNCQCWIRGSCPCWECSYHHVCQVGQHTGCLKGLWQRESLRCNLMECNERGICWVQSIWKNIGSIWTNAEFICQALYDDLIGHFKACANQCCAGIRICHRYALVIHPGIYPSTQHGWKNQKIGFGIGPWFSIFLKFKNPSF